MTVMRYPGRVMRAWAKLVTESMATALAGCAAVTTVRVKFDNVRATGAKEITAVMVRPVGSGPFPAVVQLHGCAGVEAQSFRWARWFADHGYVALVVDSLGP